MYFFLPQENFYIYHSARHQIILLGIYIALHKINYFIMSLIFVSQFSQNYGHLTVSAKHSTRQAHWYYLALVYKNEKWKLQAALEHTLTAYQFLQRLPQN